MQGEQILWGKAGSSCSLSASYAHPSKGSPLSPPLHNSSLLYISSLQRVSTVSLLLNTALHFSSLSLTPSCSTSTSVQRVSTVSCTTLLFCISLLNPLNSLHHTPSVLVYSREFLVSCLLLQFLPAQNQACCSWLKQALMFWVKSKFYADLLLFQPNFLFILLHASPGGADVATTQNPDDHS